METEKRNLKTARRQQSKKPRNMVTTVAMLILIIGVIITVLFVVFGETSNASDYIRYQE